MTDRFGCDYSILSHFLKGADDDGPIVAYTLRSLRYTLPIANKIQEPAIQIDSYQICSKIEDLLTDR
jgi:hypothetical protein